MGHGLSATMARVATRAYRRRYAQRFGLLPRGNTASWLAYAPLAHTARFIRPFGAHKPSALKGTNRSPLGLQGM